MKNDAKSKIDFLTVSKENYIKAWSILENAYENKKIIKSTLINKLLNLPKAQKNEYKVLGELADVTMQCVESLASFNVNIPSDVIVCMIEGKLDDNTSRLWSENSTLDDFDSLENLTKFLYRTAAWMSCRGGKRPNSKDSNDTPAKNAKKDSKTHHKVFVTHEKKCVCCEKSGHPLFKCQKFIELNVTQRSKVVKEAHLCYNCLKSHKGKDCTWKGCQVCNKKHNTLLHRSNGKDLPAAETNNANDKNTSS